MSNALTIALCSVACPTCGAAVGERCTESPDKKGAIVHPARRRLGYITQQPVLHGVPFLRTKPTVRGGASGRCKRTDHGGCSGTYRANHGGGMQPCGCGCHREAAANAAWAAL
jgi:hypothetical protein